MSAYQKSELISVDEAVAKGRSMLLLPRVLMIAGLFFFLFPIALLVIALMDGPAFTGKIWLIAAGVVLFTFVVFLYLPFLYWSKRTTAWKLWAFDNVDDVHELKIVALQAHLFAVYGSVMDHLQIQSAEERERWHKLQDRFSFPGIFRDDESVAAETGIYFSKIKLSLNILLGLFILVIGVVTGYLSLVNPSAIWIKLIALVMTLGPLYMIITTMKDLFNRQPQLILNNEGLYTAGSGLVPWDIVYNVEVKRITQGRRGVKYTLHFQYPGGIVNIDITEFAISRSKLEKLIRVYRGRFNQGV